MGTLQAVLREVLSCKQQRAHNSRGSIDPRLVKIQCRDNGVPLSRTRQRLKDLWILSRFQETLDQPAPKHRPLDQAFVIEVIA